MFPLKNNHQHSKVKKDTTPTMIFLYDFEEYSQILLNYQRDIGEHRWHWYDKSKAIGQATPVDSSWVEIISHLSAIGNLWNCCNQIYL